MYIDYIDNLFDYILILMNLIGSVIELDMVPLSYALLNHNC